jgi:probable HAF family extracellular repeat protein
MKSRLLFTTLLLGWLALLAMPVELGAQENNGPSRYAVTDLGMLGGSYSYGYGINNAGVASGGAATDSQTGGVSQTAFLWDHGYMTNLGTLQGSACLTATSSCSA